MIDLYRILSWYEGVAAIVFGVSVKDKPFRSGFMVCLYEQVIVVFAYMTYL
jgi:hypothetical protein